MLSKNAIAVLERRYLKKDTDGRVIETPEDLFARVSKAVAEADRIFDAKGDVTAVRDAFYRLLSELKFLPNSPTLMNAGRSLGQLSACFVLPVGDSMEEIFDAVKYAALIHKSGGGTGFSFSDLRPAGSSVRSTGGVASGPVSFMRVFNAATEAVKQGGTRRGANMGILRVDHPDILDFIACKEKNTEITNFNISVGITDEFMRAVEEQREYDLIDPRTKSPAGALYAPDVFAQIVERAWQNGEPGIVFLDRINRDNPVPGLGEIKSTNPCGEQPLLPYESCNLGSLNLDAFVKFKDGEYALDFEELADAVKTAVHFLGNVIEINRYPLELIRDKTLATRKIGLGVMGFADVLFKLGIPYGSEESVQTAEKIMAFIQKTAREASRELAESRGTFPAYEQSELKKTDQKQRNATVTTIAPTGTISLICGVSSGIEPIFALSYIRNVMDNDELTEVHPYFEEALKKRGLYSEELMKKISKSGSIAQIEEIPDDLKQVFVTAHDISPGAHIKIQAAFQKYTDNAVSKTVNFAHNATKEDVEQVYLDAYRSGLKGVTIYRDGSRDEQVLNIEKVNKKSGDEPAPIKEGGTEGSAAVTPRLRPEVTRGMTQKVKIGCGNLYITVNYDDDGICEVFTNLGRAGGCPSQSEATGRLVSIALRSGIDVRSIVGQLRGIRCHSTLRKGDVKVLSCPDAIGRVLQAAADIAPHHQYAGAEKPETEPADKTHCPECGSPLDFESGCNICRSCGYSKCG